MGLLDGSGSDSRRFCIFVGGSRWFTVGLCGSRGLDWKKKNIFSTFQHKILLSVLNQANTISIVPPELAHSSSGSGGSGRGSSGSTSSGSSGSSGSCGGSSSSSCYKTTSRILNFCVNEFIWSLSLRLVLVRWLLWSFKVGLCGAGGSNGGSKDF